MTKKLKQILDNLHKYNMEHIANVNFGLSEDIMYDVLVVAPSYSPYKVIRDTTYKITETGSQSYCTGYEVEKDELKIAWIKTAAGGCNMLDYLLICGELQFKKLIFIGAVGALKESFNIGDICTPSYSIAMEYTHLDEIKSFDTDLIEMETSTFYAVASLMQIPAIALLVVSDNSATGIPLVGRSEEIQKIYEYSRKVVLIDLIYKITRM